MKLTHKPKISTEQKKWILSGMSQPLTQLASTNLCNNSPLIGIVCAPIPLYPLFVCLVIVIHMFSDSWLIIV